MGSGPVTAKPENLHELTREALASARALFPEPLVDVEHRGEGDGEIDKTQFSSVMIGVLVWALGAVEDGESVWMRSSGVDASMLTVDVRWIGAEPERDRWSLLTEAAKLYGASLTLESDAREHRVRFSLPRLG